jgi:hypothetical protein
MIVTKANQGKTIRLKKYCNGCNKDVQNMTRHIATKAHLRIQENK